MILCNETDLSLEIDVAKSNNSKECIISNFWYFNHRFKFQDPVCYGCHDLTMLFLNLSDIVIVTVKVIDYRCIIHDISKPDAIHLLENFALDDRGYI